MKKFTILLLFVAQVFVAKSQSKTNFEFGIRYRMTPINLNYRPYFGSSNIPYSTSPDAQMSGFSLLTGFEHNFNPMLSVGYMLATRYDEKFTEFNYPSPTNKIIKDFFFDNSFNVNYKVIAKPNFKLSLGFGLSFCNENTQYSYNVADSIFWGGGAGVIVFTHHNDLKFETMDFPINIILPNIKFCINPSFSVGHKFWTMPSTKFLLLNLSAIYSINLPSKKTRSNDYSPKRE